MKFDKIPRKVCHKNASPVNLGNLPPHHNFTALVCIVKVWIFGYCRYFYFFGRRFILDAF